MRSLIRGHRRLDSSTSDLSKPPEPALPKPSVSPIVPCLSLNMTPPQAFGGHTQSSTSSPKNLLLPIKKMFGHHAKSPNPGSNVNNISPVVYGEFEPPKGLKPIAAQSLTNWDDIHHSPNLHRPNLPPLHSLSLFDAPSRVRCNLLAHSVDTIADGVGHLNSPGASSQGISSHSRSSLGIIGPETPKPDPGARAVCPGVSSVSLKPGEPWRAERSTREKQPVRFDMSMDADMYDTFIKAAMSRPRTSTGSDPLYTLSHIAVHACHDTEMPYEAEDELRDSDSSSQFSFVKDMVGGRNTSIKYYKTKSQMKKLQPRKDFIGEGEIALDEDMAVSDYDFENNGMDDDFGDDNCDDDFEANHRFNEFLSDDAGYPAAPLPEERDLIPPNDFAPESHNSLSHKKISYKSLSPAVDAHEKSLDSPVRACSHPADVRSPGYDDDSLDSYLVLPMLGALHLLDLATASDNARTDGNPESAHMRPLLPNDGEVGGLQIFLREERPSPTGRRTECRKSIKDMMGTLELLESDCLDTGAQSAANIMGMLNRIEGDVSEDANSTDALQKVKDSLRTWEQSGSAASPEAKAHIRRSMADMVNTLSILDAHLEKKTESSKYRRQMSNKLTHERKPGHKRYSWCNEPEKIGTAWGAEEDDPGAENVNGSLDQDLINEINLFPEDFDFSSVPEVRREGSGFYRSNSYNKRPEKMVEDFKYQDNKIQTPLKTVTFYRGNAKHSLNVVSRSTGLRVPGDFHAHDKGDDPDAVPEAPGLYRDASLRGNALSPHVFLSNDPSSWRPENLERIEESDAVSI